jgi:hypothetical protein
MSDIEFEITKGPSIGSKDHVILKSLSELRRLCHLFNIPLLHMPKAQFYVGNVPAGNADSYNIFFAYMSGLYYTYTEQNEDTRGASS